MIVGVGMGVDVGLAVGVGLARNGKVTGEAQPMIASSKKNKGNRLAGFRIDGLYWKMNRVSIL